MSLGLPLNLFLFLAPSSNCCRQNFKHDFAEASSSCYNTCSYKFSCSSFIVFAQILHWVFEYSLVLLICFRWQILNSCLSCFRWMASILFHLVLNPKNFHRVSELVKSWRCKFHKFLFFFSFWGHNFVSLKNAALASDFFRARFFFLRWTNFRVFLFYAM